MDGSDTQLTYQTDSQTGPSTMANVESQRPLYTVPGILHFLQHEWTRFEIERQQWETERAEFQVKRIASFHSKPSIIDFVVLGTYCFSSGRKTRTRKPEKRTRQTYQNARIRIETRKVNN